MALARLLGLLAVVLCGPAWAKDGGAEAVPTALPSTAATAEPKVDGAAPVTAEPSIPKSEPPDLGEQDLNLGWVLARTLVVLGLVVLSVYLVLNHGLRRLMGVRAVGGPVVIDVLERVPLDTKRTLFVVKAAGEYLLLGGAEASVSLIAKLDAAEVEKLRAEARASSLTLSPLLTKLMTKKAVKPPSKET